MLTLVLDNNTAYAYKNGAAASSSISYLDFTPGDKPILCALDGSGPNDFFDGDIDEVRISAAARSEDWIWASYTAVENNDGLLDYGRVSGPSAGTLIFGW